ncbi:MAG: DUF3500 domain-containing protein [Pirellulaceae bacterium]
MMLRRLTTCLLVGIALTAMGSFGYTYFTLVTTGERMTEAAGSLLASLDDEQKKAALLPYDSDKRVDWHFIPKDQRKGAQIKHMTEAQREKTHQLLQVALSQVGYDKTTKIITLETLLKHLQTQGPIRDPLRYYVTLFGEPKADSRWGLSFEGHHLSLNFVVEGEKVISSSPHALCTNPAELKDDYLEDFPKGMRVLADEETLAYDLVNSLSDKQRKKAIFAAESLAEIRAPGEPHPPTEEPVGIAASDLNEKQAETLRKLIDVYINNVPQDVANERRSALKDAGFEKIHFGWAGGLKEGVPHYYRVQGPSFVIELVNSQPDQAGNLANHVHCVWRDMRGDFALPIQ